MPHMTVSQSGMLSLVAGGDELAEQADDGADDE